MAQGNDSLPKQGEEDLPDDLAVLEGVGAFPQESSPAQSRALAAAKHQQVAH